MAAEETRRNKTGNEVKGVRREEKDSRENVFSVQGAVLAKDGTVPRLQTETETCCIACAIQKWLQTHWLIPEDVDRGEACLSLMRRE